MKNLATKYREAQFFAHAAHNLVQGNTFFPDHKFLGQAYEAYTKAYDDIIERIIGSGDKVNPLALTLEAAKDADNNHDLSGNQDSYDLFYSLLDYEKQFCAQIKTIIADGVTHGTSNLLEGLADESEMRQYKIKQRIL